MTIRNYVQNLGLRKQRNLAICFIIAIWVIQAIALTIMYLLGTGLVFVITMAVFGSALFLILTRLFVLIISELNQRIRSMSSGAFS